jgi:2-polyprenyl-6-methoxyphenol hydroxylase-like FAD-dependent oxidoreductase
MRKTEVAVVGGGLAGSLAAAMLGRAGVDCVLIDPHAAYPDDFRCEKLDGAQVALLRKTGLADAVLRISTPDVESWVARFGRVIERRRGDQQGIFYASLVNAIRAEIPLQVARVTAKAVSIAGGSESRIVGLSNGDSIEARLVVLANGLSVSLRDQLGLTREIISPCHSISIGFNMLPAGRSAFAFPALTSYAEHPEKRGALITMFPIGAVMRANLFVYRNMEDPWLRAIRSNTQEALFELMPSLHQTVGPFTVEGRVQVRPVDLYVTHGHRQGGIVLVGDAFSTSCPAAGTGARKALTDVERLCNFYIPQWLTTAGMGAEKIDAFYDDPAKRACDLFSVEKAFALKAASIGTGWKWEIRRRTKFAAQYVRGRLRSAVRTSFGSGGTAGITRGLGALPEVR